MLKGLVCPISGEKIDSNVSRLTIFVSVLLVIAFIATHQPILLYIAAFDYFIRAFGNIHFSPLRLIASKIARALNWQPRMIDKAPKVFASRLGFVCLFTASILFNLELVPASIVIVGMTGTLFLLDAMNIICVGCLIYHKLVFPFYNNGKH